ncbi:MAG: phenylalanine--tRNA ligase subunit beta [Bacteroidales bacterium]|jgi:phenylalanyl-tRNA synthetase beta chain|nr:phenylalanine--tRNA ligase subunit beta [Bacteroidales bacterium]
MKISYNWLKDYVKTTLSADQAANLLTFAGLEVEEIEVVQSLKGGLEKYYVGEVLSCEPHPDSDHLHLTQVEVGFEHPLNIVCGAPNVKAGIKVIVATLGAKVYTDADNCFEIKRTKLRGAVSEGMICSEKELGLSDNHDGILVLPPQSQTGQAAKDYFNITEDHIFEIGLTPNRSDAASHIGVARDLAAVLNSRCNEKKYEVVYPCVDGFESGDKSGNIGITIDESLCSRYSALVIKDLKIAPSPQWLQERLRMIGLKPINNVVDITNFVLMETGQPLHAFDFDKIESKSISVRTMPKGTTFITLDGVSRTLNGNEAIVSDGDKAMCLGGIYGGQDSGVSNDTRNILLESAYFNPVAIRKASKHHNLKTDASFRFERGGDANITTYALKRAALLMQEIACGNFASELMDVYPKAVKPAVVELNFDRMDSLIGKRIDRSTVKLILTSLEMNIVREDQSGLTIEVPTNKVDVNRECDVIEEVLRIYGYNNVEMPQSVKSSLSYEQKPNQDKIQNIVSDLLSSLGFNETMCNSLSKTAYYDNNADFPAKHSVNVLNALSKDLGVMRQTLLYGGMETLAYNINRKTNNIRIFEFGNCYKKNPENANDSLITKRYDEQKHLALLVTGNVQEETWQQKPQKADFFYLKNVVMNVLQRLRLDLSAFEQQEFGSGDIKQGLRLVNRNNGKTYVCFGQVDAKVCKAFDLKQEVYYADFAWDLLIKILPKKEIKYREVVKFPAVRRDLALVVDKAVTFAQMEQTALQYEKRLLRKMSLFDVYEGEKLESGKKQYAISFILQDNDKTLTDKQIDGIMNKLLKGFEDKLGAKLR